MQNLLKQLLTAAAQGQLAGAMVNNANNLNPQLASEARDTFLKAVNDHDGAAAIAAASVAAAIYGRIGDSTEQLRNLTDVLQMEFMRASTVAEYKDVRHHGQGLAQQADKAKSPEFAFRALVVAADAAYFAAEADTNDVPWLILTLQDLVNICNRAEPFQRTRFFIKFVDLLAASVEIGMSRMFLPKDQVTINGLLRSLATKVDQVIPPDIEFPDNPEQTARIAARLARLTDKYAS